MQFLVAAPVTLALVYRAYSHASLTGPGIVLAAITAIIHALPPSPIPFTLLVVFFLLGTSATKVKKDVKASLTLSSTGHRSRSSSGRVEDWFGGGWNKHKLPEIPGQPKKSTVGGQEPRSSIQVLANSGCASLLCLLHVYIFGLSDEMGFARQGCFGTLPPRDLILIGVMANYAAVTADTLSSELGILSKAKPRLILNFREVPAGTNGGVTGTGLFAGLGGALVIGAISVAMLPNLWQEQCTAENGAADLFGLVLMVGAWGALGSVLDSVLGALLQASVVDRRSGKVVEAHNGGRVLISSQKEKIEDNGIESRASRILGSGRDVLDNNQVNFLMASVMTVGAVVLASQAWEVPLRVLWSTRYGVSLQYT